MYQGNQYSVHVEQPEEMCSAYLNGWNSWGGGGGGGRGGIISILGGMLWTIISNLGEGC